MLESIKEDKRLSLSHWRYRLLHWCFGVKAPETNCDGWQRTADLPAYLYTHYCPLFHITNLIAILLPLIILIKLIKLVICAAYAVVKEIDWHRIFRAIALVKLKTAACDEVDASARKAEIKKFHELLRAHARNVAHGDVEAVFFIFYETYGSNFKLHKEFELVSLYDKYLDRYVAAAVASDARRARYQQTLIFWSNFSRVFVKAGIFLGYAALGLLLLWGVYETAVPILNFLGNVAYWLWELLTAICSWAFLYWLIRVTLALVFLAGTGYAAVRTKTVQRAGDALWSGFHLLSPPFYVVGSFIAWLGGALMAFAEFVSVFYEENCPAITIISPEDEAIEQEAP